MARQPSSFEEEIHLEDLCRQKSVFSVISLLVLSTLLFLHTFFSSILGKPSLSVIFLLGLGLLLASIEFVWLKKQALALTEETVKTESWVSIGVVFLLAGLLIYITDRDETPDFVLLAIPILQCAYVFGLLSTIMTIAAADCMIFGWLWHFFILHPPVRASQYLEAGMLSVIYVQMGILVWFLVNRLKSNQARLTATLNDLKSTRAQLISEEKLAAVGRFASGIAHEIRNPVAMISSSLSTAAHPETEPAVREEMFTIAAQESKRLELLTLDFLTYARPSRPNRSPVLMKDLLCYIANVTRAHAAGRSISIEPDLREDLPAEIDLPQVEGALLNLVLNAVDAVQDGGVIKLRAGLNDDLLHIDVQNTGPSIPASNIARIFEPFFTTKATGTGLGLAIAKGTAQAHGGDLWLSSNQDGCVTFTMTLKNAVLDRTLKGGSDE